MGADSADHHCAKGYMCHMVDTSLLRGVMEKSINHQWKLNGIVKDAHQKKMTLWFVWLLSREGNREISKVFIPQVTLIHPLPCGNVVLMMGVELENSCQAPSSVHAFCCMRRHGSVGSQAEDLYDVPSVLDLISK
jgi:hypothetical protein